eukprot:CAMPEP_0114163520 /NCGR_PEP_ID=MMETSP0043_2-20121206/30134_1 /TAXON_ID=464988 /ORGANISM="Hemiselmis andersenii, Strain CCMP644" /LENGTH=52 /DNA_ID=CAMNT_0001260031 /DNA_START=14 /DNA_END=169 /DNA_ORIENTATION=-
MQQTQLQEGDPVQILPMQRLTPPLLEFENGKLRARELLLSHMILTESRQLGR